MEFQTEKTPDEIKRERDAAIAALIESAVANREAQILDDVKGKIQDLAKPRGEDIPEIHGQPRTGGSVQPRVNSNVTRLYGQLSADEREWRSPDADHWYKHWLVAFLHKNRESMFRADAELEKIFGRAEILEGAPDTGGGIGAGTGADLLPHPLGQVVMTARDRVNKIRRLAQPVQLTTQTLQLPTFGAVQSYMTAEGATSTQDEPDPSNVLFRANKAQAYAVASKEFVRDSAFNVVNLLAVRAGGSLGALEDTQAGTSSGTAPSISAKLAGGNVDEATSTELRLVDLISLYFAVGQAYRAGAVWLGDAAMLTGISGMLDTNGRPILNSVIESTRVITDDPNAEGTIFRKPVFEFPLAAGIIFFGNVRAGYVWASRQGIEVEASEHVLFATDKIAFKFTERVDGNIVDAVAMKQMAGIATWINAS
jgi:HK97 family phage major capsid protein